MIEDIDCPFCKFEFQGKLYEDGKCPQCEEEYYWETISCIDDKIDRYEDWDIVEWYRHKDLQGKYDFKR